MPQAATITTHTYRVGNRHDQTAELLRWLDVLTCFLEDLDQRFQASTLPTHRFAFQWTPICLLEGVGFDLPLYELPVDRDQLWSHEQRLADLGVRLVVLRVPTTAILNQCLVSTRAYRGTKWGDYLQRFGTDDRERALCLDRLQRRLLEWAYSSPLPCHIIDSDDKDWDTHARRVCELISTPP
ncbi:hypothetical protein ACOQFL_03420 [Actinopolyspora sp. H202]|uniref:hypothetical protein n=1 Tax=Actinopolyspora sp. H202 TaxID=1500456 RepID=UPI003EE77867